MTDRTRKTLWLLGAALAVSALVAVKLAVDRHRLASAYSQTRASLVQLEAERARLNEQLASTQHAMADQGDQLTELHAEVGRIHTELAALQGEVETLHAANHSLQQQLALTIQDKQGLESKLSSIKELKLALRSVRAKIWRGRWQTVLAGLQWHRPASTYTEGFVQGNRGFVVRDGVPTLGSVTKLQVRVLEPQPQ